MSVHNYGKYTRPIAWPSLFFEKIFSNVKRNKVHRKNCFLDRDCCFERFEQATKNEHDRLKHFERAGRYCEIKSTLHSTMYDRISHYFVVTRQESILIDPSCRNIRIIRKTTIGNHAAIRRCVERVRDESKVTHNARRNS